MFLYLSKLDVKIFLLDIEKVLCKNVKSVYMNTIDIFSMKFQARFSQIFISYIDVI